MIDGLVSIVIPVYNLEDYLSQCLESVVKQTYSNIEVLLVDDGSVDLSGEICDRYAAVDSRLKVFHLKNGGVSSARNVGIKNSAGEFITFIDGDDWVEAEYIQEMHRLLIDENADISVIGLIEDNGKTQTTILPFLNIQVMEGIKALDYINDEEHPWIGFACGKLYRAGLLRRHGLTFDETITICEDSLFNCSAMLVADCVVTSNHALYNYRIRETSATRTVTTNPEKLKTKIEAFKKIEKIASNYPDSEFYKRVKVVLLTTYLYYLTIYCNLNRYDKEEFTNIRNCIKLTKRSVDSKRLSRRAKIKLSCLYVSTRLFFILVKRKRR